MVQICSSGEKKEKIKNIYHRHSHSLSLAHIKLTRKSLFSVFSPFVLFKNSVALMLLPPLLLLLFPSRISSFQNKSILLTRKSFPYTHTKNKQQQQQWERANEARTECRKHRMKELNIGIDVVRRMLCYVMYYVHMRICRISETVKYIPNYVSWADFDSLQITVSNKQIPNVYALRIVNAPCHVFGYFDGAVREIAAL